MSTCTTSPCVLNSFYSCEQLWAIVPSYDSFAVLPNIAYGGNSFVALGGGANYNWQGSIGQKLSCSLRKDKLYRFRLAIARTYTNFNIYPDAGLCIWGNTDSCSKTELLWHSPLLDTIWKIYPMLITPSVDYEFIQFRVCYLKDGNVNFYFTNVYIDSLSDIYPVDGGAVSVGGSKDTSIAKGQCIKLAAQPSIATYDTVLWYRYADSSLSLVGSGLQPTVCPTQSSTYIVALRDSVTDCAGIWWSYDTLRVWIDTTVGIREVAKPTRLGVQLYPNPTQGQLLLEILLDRILLRESAQLNLYDLLGRAVYTQTVRNEEIINLPALPRGVYTVAVSLREHSWHGKLVMED